MNALKLDKLFYQLKKTDDISGLNIQIETKIPEAMPDFGKLPIFEEIDKQYVRRLEACLKSAYQSAGMFGFVSWKWVNPFVDWIDDKRCLEIMAGRGWLTYALKQKGVNVVGTDNYSWFGSDLWNVPLTDILALDAVDAVRTYGKDIDLLICSWPWLDQTMYQVAKLLSEINPSARIVYIGEGWGGLTADDHFHQHFKEIKDDVFEMRVKSKYEQWDMHQDHMMLGRFI
ncbi:hypothetical protein ACM26V_07240 [Salipaludibacillus sp. HK11]|uniref:hypothetical protein n=1 Tax=Salipaludibacillus sp. HK11 TaxID=3394320 RepID=UPI0039FD8CBC